MSIETTMPDWLHRNAGLFSPQRLEILVGVEEFLLHIEYDDHSVQLEQVDSDTTESNEITARVEDILHDHLRGIAQQHGVVIAQSGAVTLKLLWHMVKAIVDMGRDFNQDVLETTFDDDADPEWILSTWISQVITEYHPPAYLAHYVESVEYALIEAINRRLDRLGDAQTHSETVSRYKAFIEERREGIVYEFIRRRKALPHYFIHTARALGPEIAKLPLERQIAWEWASLAMSSELPSEELADALRDVMEEQLLPEQYVSAYPQTLDLIKGWKNDQV